MKPLPSFRLHRPGSLKEALELLSTLEEVKPIAGGTDLIPLLREEGVEIDNLVDLSYLRGLNYIREEGGFVTIGATTTHTQLLGSEIVAEKARALHEAVANLGSVQIRNRGTIGGNLCNASPASDTAPPLLVLGSEVTVASSKEMRTMPLEGLFAGPKINSLAVDELLTEIRFPAPPPASGSAFHRIGRRTGFTLSVVNAAAYVEREKEACCKVRIAFGSVAPTPMRVPEIESVLEGREPTASLMEEVGDICKGLVRPVDDIRGSARYRCEMARILVKRALRDAWIRAGGEIQ